MKNLNLIFTLFLSVSLFTACKKSTNNKSDTSTTTITATYYLKGTLNGQVITWQASVDGSAGYFTGSSSTFSNNLGVYTGGLTALLSGPASLGPQLGVEFKTINVSYDKDITAYFNSFVNTGTWAFATNGGYTAGMKAVVIYYTDAKGNQYSSIGSQSGNSVSVSAVTPIPAQLGVSESLKIKLNFNCTLYPLGGSGGNLTLSNAEATVLLEDQIPH